MKLYWSVFLLLVISLALAVLLSSCNKAPPSEKVRRPDGEGMVVETGASIETGDEVHIWHDKVEGCDYVIVTTGNFQAVAITPRMGRAVSGNIGQICTKESN